MKLNMGPQFANIWNALGFRKKIFIILLILHYEENVKLFKQKV